MRSLELRLCCKDGGWFLRLGSAEGLGRRSADDDDKDDDDETRREDGLDKEGAEGFEPAITFGG